MKKESIVMNRSVTVIGLHIRRERMLNQKPTFLIKLISHLGNVH